MKKIFSIIIALAATLAIATSCADVPMPYDIFANGDTSFGKKLPYKSASFSSFSMHDLKGFAAWSTGSSYTQATGYQAWEGSTKTNKEVESYLISPALNTKCASGKVRISFDQTIRYENKVSNWQNNHKVYISKNFSGNSVDFDKATWTELAYTPKASTTNDWTLYGSGYIAVPEEFVNHDSVYVAFYFYAPEANSTTWELMNFIIEEGEADNSDIGGSTGTDENAGTKEAPLTVAEAKTRTGNAYVAGYIVGYIDGTKLEEGAKFSAASADETELLLADAPDCKDANLVIPVQLPVGELRTKLNPSKAENIGKLVIVYGSLETYFGTTGVKSTSWAKIDNAEIGKDPEAPVVPVGDAKGDGTKDNPFNVAGILKTTQGLAADTNSDKEFYFEGIICDDPNVDTGSYGNATFHISDDGSSNNSFYIFRTFSFDGAKFTTADTLKKGDKVVICAPVVNYKGNTPETVANKGKLISVNGKTTSTGNNESGNGNANSGNTGTGTSEAVTISDSLVILKNLASSATDGVQKIIDLSTLGKANAEEMGEITVDGITIKFDANGETNAPKYYDGTKGARVYARNTITITGTSNINSIEFECDVYNGTKYTGNAEATVAFNSNTAVYTNAYTGSGGGTQLRVKRITITYAAGASARYRTRK